MLDLVQYLKGILKQVYVSYTILQSLNDKPGDLETIRRSLAKINGSLVALSIKLESNKQELEDYQYILMPIRNYLANHEFFREIDTMSLLYANDPMRLRNLRLSILDTMRENNLLEHIKSIIRE